MTRPDTSTGRIQVQVPDAPPAITPAVARLLLDILVDHTEASDTAAPEDEDPPDEH